REPTPPEENAEEKPKRRVVHRESKSPTPVRSVSRRTPSPPPPRQAIYTSPTEEDRLLGRRSPLLPTPERHMGRSSPNRHLSRSSPDRH
ncbi:unnamed protein product, partial [Cyprideis torosa]